MRRFCCWMLLMGAIFGVAQAQTKLSYPGASANAAAECAKNPSTPNCAEPRSVPADQIQVTESAPLPALGAPNTQAQVIADDTPTEFQEFVANGTGRTLPIFGRNLFAQVPSTFAPIDHIAVPANYVLGPGDELLIRAWGQIDLDARVSVDRTGAIYLPRVGSIMVAGLPYQQLPEYLKGSIGRIFKNFDLVVTLGQLRSIQVLVVGHAQRPGVYTVSSLSTMVNTLFASGGPSNRGSMRQIQLKRGGRVITTFDIYDLLLKGDTSRDVVLMPGDVIYVPSVGPQVALIGSVNMPGIYELSGTTSLGAQLEAAGGMTSVADGERAVVERIDERSTRRIEEFKLDAAGLGRELHDGDVVRLSAISPKIENSVTLRGNVARPGRYAWSKGMHIRDLIPTREFLLTREFWQEQNTAADARRIGNVNPAGENTERTASAIEAPKGSKQDEPNNKLLELRTEVKRAAPELNWEYAVVQRMDRNTLSTQLISFNLGHAMAEANGLDNLALEPGDIVTIFSQGDIAVPMDKRSKIVRLEGEFRAPGTYRVQPNESLKSLIERAGGLTKNAYLFGAVFTRESARVEQQKSLEEMVRNLEISVQQTSTAHGQRSDQDAAMLQMQMDRGTIETLRRIKATGRVVLDSKSMDANAATLPDVELEDGDNLYVPSQSSTVTVVGAVYNPNSFVYKPNVRLGNYLQLAGSGTRQADSKHMFVVRADGSVVSSDNSSAWGGGVRSLRGLPGDMIVVPPQISKGAFMRGLKDWSQVISQFGLGVAAAFVFTR